MLWISLAAHKQSRSSFWSLVPKRRRNLWTQMSAKNTRVQRKCSVALWCLCQLHSQVLGGAINNIGRDFKCLRRIRRNQQTKPRRTVFKWIYADCMQCDDWVPTQDDTPSMSTIEWMRKIYPGNPPAISENDCSRIQESRRNWRHRFRRRGCEQRLMRISDAKLYLSFSFNLILTKLSSISYSY